MPELNDITKWVTLGGAVLGGLTGTLTYWAKLTEKRDRINVGMGSLEPPIAPGESLYVVSRSDHQLRLHDYGFVDEAGRLLSLPNLWTNSFDEDDGCTTRGSTTFEKRGDSYEVSNVRLRDKQIAAYARVVGQTWKCIDFSLETPIFRRLYLRLKIWVAPEWQ